MKDDLLFELKNIEKSFFQFKESKTYIKEINFSLKKGEIVSILGPSGCGKTTILKIVGGILSPSKGSLNYSRSDLRISYVPQQPSLMPNRTVYDNVALVLEIIKQVDSSKIKNILQKIGMSEYESMYPHQLSGGMQQKVSLARALVLKPDILLMDEPFSSIDEIARWKFNFDLIELIDTERLSVLFVTHNIEEAVLLSDRILIMSQIKPTSIEKEIRINFKGPRNQDLFNSNEYFQQVISVRSILENQTSPC